MKRHSFKKHNNDSWLAFQETGLHFFTRTGNLSSQMFQIRPSVLFPSHFLVDLESDGPRGSQHVFSQKTNKAIILYVFMAFSDSCRKHYLHPSTKNTRITLSEATEHTCSNCPALSHNGPISGQVCLVA